MKTFQATCCVVILLAIVALNVQARFLDNMIYTKTTLSKQKGFLRFFREDEIAR